ncbi:hypothetical protein MJ_0096 [Methanocaldococcus jannaschii DSM 2661]|uniref:Uncharacterized protein MJ0096 n=1 Tax=Methanocaldococcus jannaschii (strain ATCC 43067 / DSM 2661 / JAL-1 / JCM 10045 / NBRC 100440) TaxID=243232 RepID=Y096_METJA|nr:hypothetical protein [Methanocaldococcus jannaschii]Q57561.1 RecName: Full=Uncharacterized protein MJ0096 [Methanocaldococcus jannaschii DSM 2661]AAB98087.1 hypothetical protein MJ_0096 [Methanocaldococcus jannaschii DSM 2661]
MEVKAMEIFKKYLSLNIPKKILITYFLCWAGFLFSFSVGKFLLYLSSILKSNFISEPAKLAQSVGTAKFNAVSSAVSNTVGVKNAYLTYALSYIVSNFMGCLIIMFALGALAYLYKKDLEKAKTLEEKEELFKCYQKYLLILFIFTVINPLTGLIGVNLQYSDLIAVLPHGFFEFFGFATAVVVGVELSNKILPIVKREITSKKIVILIACSFIFIFIAGMLEPIDWFIYSYAKAYGIPLLAAFATGYKNLFLYLISMLFKS